MANKTKITPKPRRKKPISGKTPRCTTSAGEPKATKQDIVLAMLRREAGATITEMIEATRWQSHSVRGFLSGALKRRLGIDIISEKHEAGQRRNFDAPPKDAN